MNARTVIAADGLPRRLFTVADVERMVEVGLIAENERVELVEGELIPMSPKGNEHESCKRAINRFFGRCCPPDLDFIPETTLRLSADTYLEPDFVVMPAGVRLSDLGPDTVLLAVEIGVSSLGYDLGRKARIYAKFGIRELWVIDPLVPAAHVMRDPGPEGYRIRSEHGAAEPLVPTLAPAFALRLEDLTLLE